MSYYSSLTALFATTVDRRQIFAYTFVLTMKKNIHPKNYRLVVFEDLNDGTKVLTRSTVASEETIKWEDGKEYPVVKVHISSSSHPFYTGQEKLVDIEGRVDKFKARRDAAAAAQKAKAEKVNKAKKAEKAEKAEEIEEKKEQPQKIG